LVVVALLRAVATVAAVPLLRHPQAGLVAVTTSVSLAVVKEVAEVRAVGAVPPLQRPRTVVATVVPSMAAALVAAVASAAEAVEGAAPTVVGVRSTAPVIVAVALAESTIPSAAVAFLLVTVAAGMPSAAPIRELPSRPLLRSRNSPRERRSRWSGRSSPRWGRLGRPPSR
jgi:hypothetical protein